MSHPPHDFDPESLEGRFYTSMESLWQFNAPRRLLVAVSGGPDSTALALLSRGLLPSFLESLAVAHFNHHLRGEESDQDEAFVRDLAESLGLPLRIGHWDPMLRACPGSKERNLQAAARQARYEFLASTARELALSVIATAHHADDQVETILFNLSRGGRTGAWQGIRDSLSLGDLHVARPLLPFTKGELVAWLDSHGQPYRIDSSNLKNKYSRNRIRNEILPESEKDNPDLRKEILEARNQAAEDERQWMQTLQIIREESIREERCWILPRQPFAEMPEAGRYYCLRQILKEFSGAEDGWFPVRREPLRAVYQLLDNRKEGSVNFPRGASLRLHGNALMVVRNKKAE